jgi:hypothetical protein
MCTFFLCLFTAWAQTPTGTLQGVITDETGGVIPGAKVLITNSETNETKELKTDALGRYVQPFLLPATYIITVEAQGFKKLRQENVKLDVAQNRSVDLRLSVGQVTEQVEVLATAPALETNTSTVGQVIENKRIMDLPLNGRSVFALANLTPGVNPTGGGATPHMGGARNAISEVQIDGMTDIAPENNIGINNRVYEPQVDSVEEFTVQVNALAAEYGRFGGGVINVVTKSGTNAFHGTAYDYLRNSKMDANNFFNNRAGRGKGVFKRNQWGGTAGGPVKIPGLYDGKDKTFFFFGIETTNSRSLSVYTGTMPIDDWRRGDFSNLRNASGQAITIFDPTTVRESPAGSGQYIRDPFPGNRIPSGRIDPVAANVVKYWPTPNTAPTNQYTFANNFTNSGSAPSNSTRMDIRGDHNFRDNWRMFLRVSRQWGDGTPFNGFGNVATSSGDGPNTNTSTNISMDHTVSFSPTLIANFRFGYGRLTYNRLPFSNGMDLAGLGFPSNLVSAAAREGFEFPRFDFDSGHASLGQAGWTRFWHAPSVQSSTAALTKVLPRHTLKWGGEYRALFINFGQSGYPSSQYSFNRGWTQREINTSNAVEGYALASFLLGLSGSGQMTHDPIPASKSSYFAGYMQDDWRITSKLTLNIGLRYEVDRPRTERWDRYTVWDWSLPSPIAGKVPASGCADCGDLRGAMLLMDAKNRRQVPADSNNWGPRFGFAWNALSKTVIRGGWGITYAPSPLQAAGSTGAAGMQGYRGSTGVNTTFDSMRSIYTYLRNPFPDGFNFPPERANGAATELGFSIGESLFDSARNPFIQQWSFNIQRELPGSMTVEVGYLGNRGWGLVDGDGGQNYSQVDPKYQSLGTGLQRLVPNPFYGIITAPTSSLSRQTIEYRQTLRPYSQYTSVSSFRKPIANSIYHGFTLRVDKRFSRGLSFLLSYTASKVRDDSSSAVGFLGPVASSRLNAYDRRLEWSLSSMDVAQRLVMSYVYEFPFGKGQKFFSGAPKGLNLLISGWQTNGILTFSSGTPIFITGVSNNTGLSGSGQRPNSTGKSAKISGGTKDERLNKWFDTSVFTQPAQFTFGNLARTLPDTRNPGIYNTELSFFKNTFFGPEGRLNLQYRVEMFNALNTPQWSGPTNGMFAGNFGQISGQAVGPRQIQMALKLIF